MEIANKTTDTSYLNALNIESGKYILSVSRFVPGNGLHDLIDAFTKTGGDQQLVIAGDADHETKYSRELKEKTATDSRIILTGYISGEYLHQVFSHANQFVLPLYHEGLPITLLEAMSYRKRGQIYFNSLVEIDPRYFRPTEVEFLLGDPSKAKTVLGWQPEISFTELVKVMVREDLQEVQRDQLCKTEGFKTYNNFE